MESKRMSRDELLRELTERRVRREAEAREAETRYLGGVDRFEQLAAAWRKAQDDANAAYAAWRRAAGAEQYAVYRAAQDRADQAQDALWEQHVLRTAAPGYERWTGDFASRSAR
jgi:hypothetical protein